MGKIPRYLAMVMIIRNYAANRICARAGAGYVIPIVPQDPAWIIQLTEAQNELEQALHARWAGVFGPT